MTPGARIRRRSAPPRGRNAPPRMLRLRVIDDAILVPRTTLGDPTLGAGVVTRDDQGNISVVADCGTRRRGRQYVLDPPIDPDPPTDHLPAAVYGGFLYAHYGHFLLESLGRLWFEQLDPATPILWIAGTTNEFTPWMTELADRIGLGADRRIIDHRSGPLGVDQLLVADPGFEVHRFFHPWLRDRLAIAEATPERRRRRAPGSAPQDSGTKLWLSRSAMGDLAGVAEEPEMESHLRSRGWTIVHPERLRIADQIDQLASARHIAGIEGSAVHTLVLIRGFTGTVDVLTRHENPNFEILADAAGWDQRRHRMPGGQPETWHRPSGARDVRWSGIDAAAAARRIDRSARRWRSRAVRRRVRRIVGRILNRIDHRGRAALRRLLPEPVRRRLRNRVRSLRGRDDQHP